MGEGDLTGGGMGAAADEPGVGDGVVGGAEGALGDEAAAQGPGDGVDGRDLEGLLGGEGREDGGDAAGDHGLAAAGRADEEDVVAAGDGDLHGAAGEGLALDVGEVLPAGGALREEGVAVDAVGGGQRLPGEQVEGLAEGLGGPDVDALDEGGLVGVGGGDDDGAEAAVAQGQHDGQDAADAPHLAAERQLAHHGHGFQERQFVGAVGGEQGQGDGQVVDGALLAEVGGGEVDGHRGRLQAEAGVAQGRVHAVDALLHRRVRQADDARARLLGGEGVDFDLDGLGADAVHRRRIRFGQHSGWAFMRWGAAEAAPENRERRTERAASARRAKPRQGEVVSMPQSSSSSLWMPRNEANQASKPPSFQASYRTSWRRVSMARTMGLSPTPWATRCS